MHAPPLRPLLVSIAILSFASSPARAEDNHAFELKTPTGTLFGTLDAPTGDPPWPVAIIIAGSGPTDRDGNQANLKNDSLKMLGHALAAHGIAVLRYDKRGVGESRGAVSREEDLRFQQYVDDVADWVRLLRHDPRFTRIAIVGHSDGSLIGMMAAKQVDGVDAFVSLEGAGRPAVDVLREQFKKNLSTDDFAKSDQILTQLSDGKTIDDVPKDLADLRPSVQPYLKSWLNVDPAKEIADLKIPILIVQGTTDIQVTGEDAHRLAGANKHARLVEIQNMNHLLKNCLVTWRWVQLINYSDPTLKLEPKLVEAVVPFLQESLGATKK
ncbi:MAG TPA: alpha/beta fold hydrolase [Pirellulales bacterium]|jgi:hypothetical protein